MSEISRILKIEPPILINHKGGEVFTSHGHICPHCNGNGSFSKEVGRERYESEDCPVCKGKGRLMAKIVVGWLPDE